MNSTRLKAVLALCCTGILGGIAPVFMKIALKEVAPVQITFTRFFFALIILFPIALFTKKLRFNKKDIPHLVLASLLFSGNIFLFVFGLQYTTSIASQLMYLLTPTLVIILSYFFMKTRILPKHIFSIIAGLIGGVILVSRANMSNLANSLGSPMGNLIILGGVCSWSMYVVLSKKLSAKYHPLSLMVVNNIMITIISFVTLAYLKINILVSYAQLSNAALISLLLLVLLNSILFFFLYQWGIKLASPFMVSVSAYLSPLAAASLAVPLFGEQITIQLVLSALLIGVSSYLTFRKK